MLEDHFGGAVAARYDTSIGRWADSDVVEARERWGGWRREPFTRESGKLVGVWQKPG